MTLSTGATVLAPEATRDVWDCGRCVASLELVSGTWSVVWQLPGERARQVVELRFALLNLGS